MSAAISGSGLADGVDLGVGREAAEPLLGEGQLAVDRDLEDAAAALHELNLGAIPLDQPGLRTEGLGLVVSSRAIFDADLHAICLTHCRRADNRD
jgi:hypothetical protein